MIPAIRSDAPLPRDERDPRSHPEKDVRSGVPVPEVSKQISGPNFFEATPSAHGAEPLMITSADGDIPSWIEEEGASPLNVSGMRKSAMMSSMVLASQVDFKKQGNETERSWNHNFFATLIVPVVDSLLNVGLMVKMDGPLYQCRMPLLCFGIGMQCVLSLASWRSVVELIELHQRSPEGKRKSIATMSGSLRSTVLGESMSPSEGGNSGVLWIFEVLGPAGGTVLLVVLYVHCVVHAGFVLTALSDFLAPSALAVPILGSWIKGRSGLTADKWEMVMKTVSFVIMAFLFLVGSVRNQKSRILSLTMTLLPYTFVGLSIAIMILKDGDFPGFDLTSYITMSDLAYVRISSVPNELAEVELQNTIRALSAVVGVGDGTSIPDFQDNNNMKFSVFELLSNIRGGVTTIFCLQFAFTTLLAVEPVRRAAASAPLLSSGGNSPSGLRKSANSALSMASSLSASFIYDGVGCRTAVGDQFGIGEYTTSVTRFAVASISIFSSGCAVAYVLTLATRSLILTDWRDDNAVDHNLYNAIFDTNRNEVYLTKDYGGLMPGGIAMPISFLVCGVAALLFTMYRLVNLSNSVLRVLVKRTPLRISRFLTSAFTDTRVSISTLGAMFLVILIGSEAKIEALCAVTSLLTFGLFNVLSVVPLVLDEEARLDRELLKVEIASDMDLSQDDVLPIKARIKYLAAIAFSPGSTAALAGVGALLLLIIVSPFSFLIAVSALLWFHRYIVSEASSGPAWGNSRLDQISRPRIKTLMSKVLPSKFRCFRPSVLLVAECAPAISGYILLHSPDLATVASMLSTRASLVVIGTNSLCGGEEYPVPKSSADNQNEYTPMRNLNREGSTGEPGSALVEQETMDTMMDNAFKRLGVELPRFTFAASLPSLGSMLRFALVGGFQTDIVCAAFPDADSSSQTLSDKKFSQLIHESTAWGQNLLLIKTNDTLGPICSQLDLNSLPTGFGSVRRLSRSWKKPELPTVGHLNGIELTHGKSIDIWWFDGSSPLALLLPILCLESKSLIGCQARVFIGIDATCTDETAKSIVSGLWTLFEREGVSSLFTDIQIIRIAPVPVFPATQSALEEGDFGATLLSSGLRSSGAPIKLVISGDTPHRMGNNREMEDGPDSMIPSPIRNEVFIPQQQHQPETDELDIWNDIPWPLRANLTRKLLQGGVSPEILLQAGIQLNRIINYHSSGSTLVFTLLPSRSPGISDSVYKKFIEATFEGIQRLAVIVSK